MRSVRRNGVMLLVAAPARKTLGSPDSADTTEGIKNASNKIRKFICVLNMLQRIHLSGTDSSIARHTSLSRKTERGKPDCIDFRAARRALADESRDLKPSAAAESSSSWAGYWQLARRCRSGIRRGSRSTTRLRWHLQPAQSDCNRGGQPTCISARLRHPDVDPGIIP